MTTPTKAQRLATQGDLDRCTAITVSQHGQIARLAEERDAALARVERLQGLAYGAEEALFYETRLVDNGAWQKMKDAQLQPGDLPDRDPWTGEVLSVPVEGAAT